MRHRRQQDTAPSYYVFGGCVFQPLTGNYLDLWRRKKDVPTNLVVHFETGKRTAEQREVVVLTEVFGHPSTVGYGELVNNVIVRVNGEEIGSMQDLVRAIEEHEGPYHMLVDEYGNEIVLERDLAKLANEEILQAYRILSDRSEDLKEAGWTMGCRGESWAGLAGRSQ